MDFVPLKLNGTFEVRPSVIHDSRGYFAESYLREVFREHGADADWLQENRSFSVQRNTIRGLHFQAPPAAQSKLISVVGGEILDVVVDIRKGSPTYGMWDAVKISSEKCNSVFIPAGFAHGFCTLTDGVTVVYKVDALYSPSHECGIIWNDPDLAIDWPTDKPVLSDRDRALGTFAELVTPF